jgi:hypothetical protein
LRPDQLKPFHCNFLDPEFFGISALSFVGIGVALRWPRDIPWATEEWRPKVAQKPRAGLKGLSSQKYHYFIGFANYHT